MSAPLLRPVAGAPGLSWIDTEYRRPGLAASFLLESAGRAAFVETGTARSTPRLLEALDAAGLSREQVDLVIITHVHLDHAGGAGTLMAALPNARLVVHPRGARHMIDPEKLTQGAIAVYGEATFREDYVELVPVPAERVLEAPDGTTVQVGDRTLEILDTPGHAYHHLAVFDPTSRSVFTGDIFGLSYRELDTDRGPFVFPTTTPIHFDPPAMHASIDRILALGADRALMTHFGPVEDLPRLGAGLHRLVDDYVAVARRHADAPDRHAAVVAGLSDLLTTALRDHGVTLDDGALQALLGMDLELNAQGLEVWLDK